MSVLRHPKKERRTQENRRTHTKRRRFLDTRPEWIDNRDVWPVNWRRFSFTIPQKWPVNGAQKANCDQNADDGTWSERQAFQRKHSLQGKHTHSIHCICSLSSLMLNQISGFWSWLCAVWGPFSLSNNCCGWFLWNMRNNATTQSGRSFILRSPICSVPDFWLIRGAHFQLAQSNKSCDIYSLATLHCYDRVHVHGRMEIARMVTTEVANFQIKSKVVYDSCANVYMATWISMHHPEATRSNWIIRDRQIEFLLCC